MQLTVRNSVRQLSTLYGNLLILWIYWPVLYQVLNKQVPVPVPVPVVQVPVPVVQVPVQVQVPNLQVPVPVQVLCINYRHSVTLQLHKVKVEVSFIFKKQTVRTNELQTQIGHNRIFWFWLARCYTCSISTT